MGIPYYFYQVFKKYNNEKDLVLNEDEIKQKTNPQYLFFDYNSLIHPCAKKTIERLGEEKQDETFLESQIINDCLQYTRYIITTVGAKDVYIIIDGVAPRAKMNQQRQRRYKNRFLKTIISEDDNVNEWDSNKITPGTSFMNKLIHELHNFKEILNQELGINITLSDSNEKGEGEHKMMKIINCLPGVSNICIYGLDADLIMLSMKNSQSSRIVLLRDNNNDNKFSFLSINKLKECILLDIRFHIGTTRKNLNDKKLLDDYIVLLFFIGNDFLLHIPSIVIKNNGIGILLKTYGKIMRKSDVYLTDYTKELKERINLDMLCDIFEELGNLEEYFFKHIYSPYQGKFIYRDKVNLEEEYKNVSFYTNDVIKLNTEGYKNRYYLYYGISITNLKDTCQNYLDGLYWVFGYYNNHEHDNWLWYYKYENTPFASDFSHFLKNKMYKNVNIESTNSYTCKEQLCMVLPRESLLNILKDIDLEHHDKLKRLFRLNTIELEKYFPTQINLNMVFKEYLWQSDIFINNLSDHFLKLIL